MDEFLDSSKSQKFIQEGINNLNQPMINKKIKTVMDNL